MDILSDLTGELMMKGTENASQTDYLSKYPDYSVLNHGKILFL